MLAGVVQFPEITNPNLREIRDMLMCQISNSQSLRYQPRFLLRATIALLFIMVIVACGESESADPASQGETGEEGLRLITKADASYSIDDLTAVGYKKNKQFDVETVPGANDIWYGFFRQKDIEVRFYDSHEAALEWGVQPAEAVIARTAGQRDPLIPVVNLYPAYAVVGNTVMLCERQLSTCEALIDVLD